MCAEALVDLGDVNFYCHIVAKYQQAVEKLVKAVATALRPHGLAVHSIGYNHGVEKLIEMIAKLPRLRVLHDAQMHLASLFSPHHRAEIIALSGLAPRRPAGGALHRRNTEYPFQTSQDQWTCPAMRGVFVKSEVERFGSLWKYLYRHASALIDALPKAPHNIV